MLYSSRSQGLIVGDPQNRIFKIILWLQYRQWHTTNAICLFYFEKLETFKRLFIKKIVFLLSATAYKELEVFQFANSCRHVPVRILPLGDQNVSGRNPSVENHCCTVQKLGLNSC